MVILPANQLQEALDAVSATITRFAGTYTFADTPSEKLKPALLAGLGDEPIVRLKLISYLEALYAHLDGAVLPDGTHAAKLALNPTPLFLHSIGPVLRKVLVQTHGQLTIPQFLQLVILYYSYTLAVADEPEQGDHIWLRCDQNKEPYYLDMEAHVAALFARTFIYNLRLYESYVN